MRHSLSGRARICTVRGACIEVVLRLPAPLRLFVPLPVPLRRAQQHALQLQHLVLELPPPLLRPSDDTVLLRVLLLQPLGVRVRG